MEINRNSQQNRLNCLFSVAIIFFLLIGSQYAVAQNTKVTLPTGNITLKTAFNEIEKQTGYSVDYEETNINVNKTVNATVSNLDLPEALQGLLKNTGYSYSIEGKHIVVSTQAAKQPGKRNKVSGKVNDASGEPVVGANVVEKGTTNGTITDLNGSFSLDIPAKSTLIISYIGYTPREVEVGNQLTFNVKLAEDTEMLDEVVVVGYGTQKKSDVTTAVASVSSDNLKNRAAVNFGEAMAGQVPGVMVQQTNGAPGGEGLTIKVRGTGSITQSNDPLYVVDGYPMEGGAFRLLNPSDIESIQVLKDASSTAIYGSRGANGVVIITTKKGQIGKPTVQLRNCQ